MSDKIRRCDACGTDGQYNAMGRFVTGDWLRANELSTKVESLAAEVAALKAERDALQRRIANAPGGVLCNWRTVALKSGSRLTTAILKEEHLDDYERIPKNTRVAIVVLDD